MSEYIHRREETAQKTTSMNPKKFALWLFMVSVVMIFASLTSAYIVRQGEGNWYIFDLPNIFYISTVIIIASSVSMHWAYIEAKKDNFARLRIAAIVTAILGITFLVLQFYGWAQLVNINVYFVGNPSGSFVYVLTGLHGLHLISGVIVILYVLVQSLRYKIHSKNLLSIDLCATYWHFLDGLWIYLFVFLLLNR
ncbi:cytochrome c oxidase subunit 3 [Chondrinema litorale]|uniref:cytochrome c oxidase subunit 3 n=1 Tax=Chondrinema litorale TaxID=2994555 RepID=UPI00254327EE|nr:cytochrome c oxidase subunit 3 [Chondrinema litorale]UZR93684.1 cytochrome c oxidase subunit 3 [Chondrinema litorale]